MTRVHSTFCFRFTQFRLRIFFRIDNKFIEMTKRALPNSVLEDTMNLLSKDDENQPPKNHRYRLRSTRHNSQDKEKSVNEQISLPTIIPFIEYKGNIHYFTEFCDIAYCCDNLFEAVKKDKRDVIPIGFDMEWPFSFSTGPGKSAVIQLCPDITHCYVLHISKLEKLPASLLELLYHPKVRLHGVNIKNDFRKLERDYPQANADKMIKNCVDLGVWYNEVQGSNGRKSLEDLVLKVCRLRINKDGKVRRSKWDIQPLSENQQLYAAIDVYISQAIYYELEKKQEENQKKTEDFIKKYGEEALTAIKQIN